MYTVGVLVDAFRNELRNKPVGNPELKHLTTFETASSGNYLFVSKSLFQTYV
jgi:hypothetical protein